MSVKKLLILTAAGLASVGATAVMAGGPDRMMPPVQADNHFYAEINGGYANQEFGFSSGRQVGGSAPFADYSGDGVIGGGVYGADFGYMFNQHLGVELGWTFLPRFSQSLIATAAAPPNTPRGPVTLHHTWGAWAVAKFVAPLVSDFNAFFKAGISFRYGDLNWNSSNLDTGGNERTMREWRPVVAVGVSYDINDDMVANLQYMRFVGGSSYIIGAGSPAFAGYVTVPPANVVTLGFGYKFRL